MRTNKLILGLMALLATVLITGCDNTPSCSDGNVKNLVVEIANEETEKQIIQEEAGKTMSIKNFEAELEEIIKKLEKGGGKTDYTLMDTFPGVFAKVISEARKLEETMTAEEQEKLNPSEYLRSIGEKIIKSAKYIISNTSLQAIRLDSKDEEAEKVQCKGQLKFANGYTHDIEYTAQHTEDGQLYVEVMGL